jgi:hypothetical protein
VVRRRAWPGGRRGSQRGGRSTGRWWGRDPKSTLGRLAVGSWGMLACTVTGRGRCDGGEGSGSWMTAPVVLESGQQGRLGRKRHRVFFHSARSCSGRTRSLIVRDDLDRTARSPGLYGRSRRFDLAIRYSYAGPTRSRVKGRAARPGMRSRSRSGGRLTDVFLQRLLLRWKSILRGP